MNNTLHAIAAETCASSQTAFPIKKVGRGELLGWEDILKGRNYTSNIRCVSLTASVFKMDAKTFLDGAFKDLDIK